MSNGARHVLGLLAGLAATPLIAFGLMFGTERATRYFRLFLSGGDRWIAAAAFVGVAVVIGLLAGSRISPLASLVPGVLLASAGGLWVAAPRWTGAHTVERLPDGLDAGYSIVGPYGVLLVLGVVLIVASLPPSRWRARTAGQAPPAPRHAAPGMGAHAMGSPGMGVHGTGAPPPAPIGPGATPGATPGPQGQEPAWAPQPRYGAQGAAPLPYGQPPGGASPAPSAPPAGSPPPRHPASGAVPFGSDGPSGAGGSPGAGSASDGAPDEGVGEWTRMYGGDDQRGGGRPS
ncbi:hypothetical protein [Actinomadura yumaensis]|uniref:Uncharacterized protein n=1 Tax=Actinomadura yumaensis TaxID=111807 RepID=A0ABW2CY15_9ACTN